MALLTVQTITRAGITPTYGAVSASDTFPPGPTTFLHVKNGGASPDSCVIQVLAGDPPGLTITDVTVSVTNGQERIIGPFPAQFFADPTTGLGTVTHGYTSTVTCGLFQLQAGL
jgi:hypothetical protein